MERIGIIDIGSNSIRLLIIDIKENKAHHQIENLKETVRLGSEVHTDGTIKEETVAYALDIISLFVKLCKSRKVNHIIAVATAAIRNAPNRSSIIQRIRRETGLKVRVLTGEEEAFLGYVGLVNTNWRQDGVMCDLGGGSLKLVRFEKRLNLQSHVFDFGAVSLMERFNLGDLPAPADLAALEDFLAENFAKVSWLNDEKAIVGVGGTFRSLARVYREHANYLPDITDGIVIPAEEVGKIYEMLQGMSLQERRSVPGLEKARADISVAGVALIHKLLEITGSSELTVATSSIRDGLFFKHIYPRDPIVFNVLTHHTKNLIDYHDLDENHLRKVSNLAVTLFDQLQELHKLGSFERRLLLIAGLLHELGVVISVESLEKHTMYTIINSPLRGLTHRERVLIAFLAASHEQLFLAGLEKHISQGSLRAGDAEIIKKLAPLLQIAHSLDRSRDGMVTHVQSRLTPEICEIYVLGAAKADLETKDAARRAAAFFKEYGTKLTITQG